MKAPRLPLLPCADAGAWLHIGRAQGVFHRKIKMTIHLFSDKFCLDVDGNF